MATKVWKGHLNFGLVSIPVYLNTGARDEHTALCQLHSCGSRTKKPDWCPKCNKQITRDEIQKAYEVGDDKYVLLTKEELDGIAPASEKVMEISECVNAYEVDEIYMAESFYLIPDEGGKHAYALLVKGLKDTGRVAIAQLTKNSREHVVLIRPSGNGLMLHALYYPNEVNRVPEFESLKEQPLPVNEIKLATRLIDSLAAKFDPEQFENGYDMRLNQLIASKLDKAVSAPAPVKVTASVLPDLTAALQASLMKPRRTIAMKEPAPVVAKSKRKAA